MPLDFLKYLIDHLSGTPYTTIVDFILSALAISGGVALSRKVLGAHGVALVKKALKTVHSMLPKNRSYAPGWDRVLNRVRPYLAAVMSGTLALFGLLATVLGGCLVAFAASMSNILASILAFGYFSAGVFYLRTNLVELSWAFHELEVGRKKVE